MKAPEGFSHANRMALLNSLANNTRILNTLAEDNDDIPDSVKNFEDADSEDGATEGLVAKGPVEVVD